MCHLEKTNNCFHEKTTKAIKKPELTIYCKSCKNLKLYTDTHSAKSLRSD